MPQIPIPPDFSAVAPGMRVAEAVNYWGVGEDVVRRWFREAGITPARLKPKGRPANSTGGDSEKRRQMCLHCDKEDCVSGICARVLECE